jgi:transposase
MGPGRPAMSGSAAGRPMGPGNDCSLMLRPSRCGRRGRLGGRGRRDDRAGPPACCWRPKRGPGQYVGSAAQADQALGRSRGGLTTKLHLACDGRGRPLGMLVTGGQRHESTQLGPLLDAIRVPRSGPGRPRKRPAHLVADRGYSYRSCRRLLRQRGIAHTIPERSDQQAARVRRGARGGRPPVVDPVRYRRAMWLSGPSLGSSSIAPSPPGTTNWRSATTAGWSWPRCYCGCPSEPSDRP